MLDDKLHQIQEQLFDYFKDFETTDLIKFVDCFTYHQPTTDEKISKLVEKFLKDMDIEHAYTQYLDVVVHDKYKDKYFVPRKASFEIIDKIKQSVLSVAFNHIRRVFFK